MGIIPFPSPFTMIISGPTSCGKSTWVFRLLRCRETMIFPPPLEVIYSLPPEQEISIPTDIQQDIDFRIHRGIPNIDEFTDKKHRLLIIDDQAAELGDSVVSLFTRLSHHFSVSVIVLTQNIFLNNPGFRTMSLNAHFIVLFKSPRAMDQVSVLGRQVVPGNIKFFQESYSDACREPHSYFLLDFTQNCPQELRFRSNIFPDDQDSTTIYLPLKKGSQKV